MAVRFRCRVITSVICCQGSLVASRRTISTPARAPEISVALSLTALSIKSISFASNPERRMPDPSNKPETDKGSFTGSKPLRRAAINSSILHKEYFAISIMTFLVFSPIILTENVMLCCVANLLCKSKTQIHTTIKTHPQSQKKSP